MDIKERRRLAYLKFKEKNPERIAELRRKASKTYYEKHKDEVREKCRERAKQQRENLTNCYNGQE